MAKSTCPLKQNEWADTFQVSSAVPSFFLDHAVSTLLLLLQSDTIVMQSTHMYVLFVKKQLLEN